jgi:hypothetical protein
MLSVEGCALPVAVSDANVALLALGDELGPKCNKKFLLFARPADVVMPAILLEAILSIF